VNFKYFLFSETEVLLYRQMVYRLFT